MQMYVFVLWIMNKSLLMTYTAFLKNNHTLLSPLLCTKTLPFTCKSSLFKVPPKLCWALDNANFLSMQMPLQILIMWGWWVVKLQQIFSEWEKISFLVDSLPKLRWFGEKSNDKKPLVLHERTPKLTTEMFSEAEVRTEGRPLHLPYQILELVSQKLCNFRGRQNLGSKR